MSAQFIEIRIHQFLKSLIQIRMPLELKNIPISISILHEQEYYNLCKMFRVKHVGRRRAFTDIRGQRVRVTPLLQL